MNFCSLLLFLVCLLQGINSNIIATERVSNKEVQSKILSRESAKLKQFSWQAGITVKFENEEIFCSGARISREWILTSATCVKNAKAWDIVLGTIKRTNYSEGAFNTTGIEGIAHEGFNAYLNNNIGLIKLAELPRNETDAMKPIILEKRKNVPDNLNGTDVVVSGWGNPVTGLDNVYSERLLFAPGWVMLNEECGKTYGEKIIVNETLCLKPNFYRNICDGDNGDPLIMYDNMEPVLVGIASFISLYGCETINPKPNGFTRTAYYLDWIQEHTNITIIDDITTTTDMSASTTLKL